ncbi:D-alanine--D-alanine ligase [Blattabacterium cuenoti]|uniref:D-alanine--D-alanine ligase n=1 Tax=Blattabacterium cuenoti TaxID=1653831 RepID=UPI00163C7393|nr:D-alanine--D-alanine ligase [Blattabacterium cuenoti]
MKNIAVVMGGYSKESSISLESGKMVYDNLCRKCFIPYCVYLFKDKWFMKNKENKKFFIDKHDFSVFVNENSRINFDCIFNAIHGSPGEDGMLQSYFDLLKIPYTGCNFHQANITFNKKYCLSLLKYLGINTAKSFFLNKNQTFCKKEILNSIGIPFFVKPSRSGSSFGITKIYKEDDFDKALSTAFKEDNEIIIESFLSGREVSVGVFSFRNEIVVLPITEIISKNDFFDFESKYSGKSKEITPANFPLNIEVKIKNTAIKVYKYLNLYGISRSEFIIVDEIPYFLEINTVPGLSKESIFPKQLKTAGISLSDFFHDFIDSSIKKCLYNLQ